MDIQEMVNARIEELRNQALKTASSINIDEPGNRLTPEFRGELEQLGGTMEDVLTGIACRILEMTEQVSGDYARLEKELLDSRLAVLQSAETVLDMALSLKNQARKVIEAGLESSIPPASFGEHRPGGFEDSRQSPAVSLSELAGQEYSARSWEVEPGCPVCSGRTFRDAEADASDAFSGRASMINNGVADLFRKTQN